MKLAIIYFTFIQSQVKISGTESDFWTNNFLREFLQKSMQYSLLEFLDKVSLAFLYKKENDCYLLNFVLSINQNMLLSKNCELRKITTIINWWVLILKYRIMAYLEISWLPNIKINCEKNNWPTLVFHMFQMLRGSTSCMVRLGLSIRSRWEVDKSHLVSRFVRDCRLTRSLLASRFARGCRLLIL